MGHLARSEQREGLGRPLALNDARYTEEVARETWAMRGPDREPLFGLERDLDDDFHQA
jgi:hypothetical protein